MRKMSFGYIYQELANRTNNDFDNAVLPRKTNYLSKTGQPQFKNNCQTEQKFNTKT